MVISLIISTFIHNSTDVKVNIYTQKVNDKNVDISMEDNRKWLSEEELNSIFKRYYRGTNIRKKTERLGLGMGIVKAHGADIKAIGKIRQVNKRNLKFLLR